MAKKKATSSDVAARAGVSQATVSMVLNRKYNVSFSRETVERVEQAARELGYELPGRRKHKADRKEKLIVVFCPTLTSPYYVLLLQGIEAVANEQGYGVFICNTQRDAGLGMPTLLLPAIQVNVRAGNFPPPEDNGITYLKIPLNKL